MHSSRSGYSCGRRIAVCSPKWWAWAPRVVAEALHPVRGLLPGFVAVGPLVHPADVARAIAASLAPPAAEDDAPGWLDAGQAAAFKLLLHALRSHGAVLCADAVGSGKTYLALAIAQTLNSEPPVAIVPPALADQWRTTADRLGVPIVIWSHARLSIGQLPEGSPGLVVLDESHHFRNPGIHRYRTLAPWLIGRRLLLLSATPIVNRPADLYHQLHLGLRDDVLAQEGVASLRTSFKSDAVPPALGRFVFERADEAEVPDRRLRDEVVPSGAVSSLPTLDCLGLSTHAEVAALVRTVLVQAAASSPAALLAALRRYRHLLLQAQDAIRAGRPPERRALRQVIGNAQEQLVMWSLLPDTGEVGDLCPGDLELLESLITAIRHLAGQADAKVTRLAELLNDGIPTLVYTSARETVGYLRRHLPDHWLAWCTGARAGIGGTALPRGDVLRWFQPDAPALPAGMPGRPRTLLTTDVTAEGLDLQGAGRVVHYDLPWTEVRLTQRNGRAVRRGSTRRVVDIVRFLPDQGVEERLRQMQALTRKSALPHRYGIGANGRSMWRWRGELADSLVGEAVEGLGAVLSDRPGALAGILLERDGVPVVTTALVRAGNGTWGSEPELIQLRLEEAARGVPGPPPTDPEMQSLLASLGPTLRSLLRTASLVRVSGIPPKPAALALGKRIRRLAADAARRRDAAALERLEAALKLCAGGHTAGEETLIEAAMQGDDTALAGMLSLFPPPAAALSPVRCRLTGLIVFHPG